MRLLPAIFLVMFLQTVQPFVLEVYYYYYLIFLCKIKDL